MWHPARADSQPNEQVNPKSLPFAANAALLALTANYAANLAETLRAHAAGKQQPQSTRLSDIIPQPRLAPGAGNELVRSLDTAAEQLGRLVRMHPNAGKLALRAEMVEKKKKARVLAGETPLQRAAACLDASADLLEILIRQSDVQGTCAATVDKIHAARLEASANAPDVLYELRETCYHNVVLWDVLLQLRK